MKKRRSVLSLTITHRLAAQPRLAAARLAAQVSDKCAPEDLITMLDLLNPSNAPGRVTIIVRMGAEKLRAHLPSLITEVQRAGRNVLWISDPVHGNTRTAADGITKTRDFGKIREELRAFFDVHDALGTHAGGVHLEVRWRLVNVFGGVAVCRAARAGLVAGLVCGGVPRRTRRTLRSRSGGSAGWWVGWAVRRALWWCAAPDESLEWSVTWKERTPQALTRRQSIHRDRSHRLVRVVTATVRASLSSRSLGGPRDDR